MKIGELAVRVGVNIQTIRFYERKGLLAEPLRNNSGYRCYAESDLDTLVFIRRSQELGFTLSEIAELLPLHQSIAASSSPQRGQRRQLRAMAEVARSRLAQIEQKLLLLKMIRSQLRQFIAGLDTIAPTTCLANRLQSRNKNSCRTT